ncbi:hypothetical protein LEN26_017091 [Aphanomyces euteiches]|nr:hypothetical protein LEN26_017091 [Aphanomyces euteiches]KAH9114083.1 hypothetical protein AeMF1_011789 [Aphanomyces euteiches]KAH9191759.1 hypothetical protein AeNC1_006276 [Aphanomyces euteiches]
MLPSLRSILLLGLLATLCRGGSIFRSNSLDIPSFQLSAALDPLSELSPCTTSTLSLDDKKAAIDFVQDQIKAFKLPGVALSVVLKNETILSKGFGTKERKPPSRGKHNSKLVDEKKVSWNDPVVTHLPWFSLTDKYAQKYTTLGDLASMNSVFGAYEGDIAWVVNVYPSDKELVQALAYLETPTRPFRASYAYSNMNFAILGQVIEAVTNQTWYDYVRKTIWTPLGMNNTFGRAADTQTPQELSFGHFTCLDKVIGPYNLVNSTIVAVNPKNDYLAAGSMISTADDLSKFSRFLLNKGRGIFSSDAIVADMITGHVIRPVNPQALSILFGQDYNPDGGAYAAGYGIDTVGDVMFGAHYFDKGGDTLAFKTRNGFIPPQNLGVTLLSNTQSKGGKYSSFVIVDLIRTYILGIFMDVPVDSLKNNFKKALAALDSNPLTPCDDHYFNGKPIDTGLTIPDNIKTILAGIYHGSTSPKFYGQFELVVQDKDLIFNYGVYSGRVIATPDPSVFALDWDRGAESNLIQVLGLNESKPQIPLAQSVTFVKD